jgi:hypothetical protein
MAGRYIGQHVADGRAPENGQRTRRDPGVDVGQLSGGEQNMAIPRGRRNADIESTSRSAGPFRPGERRGGADDKP